MSKKPKTRTLTLKQKIDIINEVESNPTKKKTTIAEEHKIPKSTLSGIMRDREKYKRLFFSGKVSGQQRRHRKCQKESIDTALLEWFSVARAANVPITGNMLMEKASEIARKLGHANWKCNEGWLHRFKRRHEIVCKTMSGERKAVDESVTDAWVEEILKPRIASYHPRDVFNVDESGLFWKLLPDSTLAFKSEKCFGGKKSKERLTFLVVTNMDGTEKLPVFTIGRSKNPRCFKGMKSPPVKYTSNAKAWMTAELFTEWLIDFDNSMHAQNRKVLLVLDNCSAHDRNVQARLKATELLFLPPNATSKLQPLDQGIIRNLKVHYRTAMVVKLMAHIDSGLPSADFQITLLDALTTLKQAWGHVTSRTIANCFRKANFDPVSPSHDSSFNSDDDRAIPQSLRDRFLAEFDIDVEEYVDVDEDVQTSDMSWSVGEETTEQNSDDEADPTTLISRKDLLESLQNVHLYCMQVFMPGDPVSQALTSFTETLHKHLINLGTQTTIPQFFQKTDQKDSPDEAQQDRDDGRCCDDEGKEGSESDEAPRNRATIEPASMSDADSECSEEEYRALGSQETEVEQDSCLGDVWAKDDNYMSDTEEYSFTTEKEEFEDMGGTGMENDNHTTEREEYSYETEVDEEGFLSDSAEEETEEVQITFQETAKRQAFVPTNRAWRLEQSRLHGLPLLCDLPERSRSELLTEPLQVDTIVGDGNCFYRALSVEVCGTQDLHEKIRAKLIDFMLQNDEPFSGYVGTSIGNYLLANTLRPNSWGSDVEVHAAATMFQTTVTVFTNTNKWLSYQPLFGIEGRELCTEQIYLRNVCAHFERVVKIKPQ